MKPNEPEKLSDAGELTVVLLAEACHGVLFLFCYEYPQYFIFPKEKEDELALLSGVVYWRANGRIK